jgi:O-antigen/teichoic acid export membrane protein
MFFINLTFPEAKTYMFLLLALPIFSYLMKLIQCYNRAIGANKEYAYMGIASASFSCFFSIILVFFIGTFGNILAQYIALLTALFFGIRVTLKDICNCKPVFLDKEKKREFISVAVTMMTASAFSMIMPINETFIVNNVIKNAMISADFKVAGLFPQQIVLISNAVIIYCFPTFAKLKNPDEIKRKGIKMGILIFLLIVPVVCIGVIITPFLINFVYGDKYSSATNISRILWAMCGLNAAVRTFPMNMLPAIGKVKFNAIASVASCIIHAILDYWLISVKGAYGVAYASVIVYSLSGFAYWFYFLRVCNKNSSKSGEKPLIN